MLLIHVNKNELINMKQGSLYHILSRSPFLSTINRIPVLKHILYPAAFSHRQELKNVLQLFFNHSLFCLLFCNKFKCMFIYLNYKPKLIN